MATLIRKSLSTAHRPIRQVKLKKFSTLGNQEEHSKNPPGLTENVVAVPKSEKVGPGASKDAVYKNPEYYCYSQMSFFEAEVELTKYRLPQPSNKK